MTDANTLTPCPFCGERAETDFIPERHSYQIECSDVFGCTARVTRESEQAAIEAWNLRSPSSASQPVAAPAQAMPSNSIITASIMRDDGGEHPAFCLMVAYRAEKDAKAALAILADAPCKPLADEVLHALYADVMTGHYADGLHYWRGTPAHRFARAIEQAHGITAAQKGGKHGTD